MGLRTVDSVLDIVLSRIELVVLQLYDVKLAECCPVGRDNLTVFVLRRPPVCSEVYKF